MTEHELFGKLHNSLDETIDTAKQIAALRPDQHNGWAMIAALLTEMKENVYKLSEAKSGFIIRPN